MIVKKSTAVSISLLILVLSLTGCAGNGAMAEPQYGGNTNTANIGGENLYENNSHLTGAFAESVEYHTVERVDLGCCVTEIEVRDTALLGANSITDNSNGFIMTLNSDRHSYSTADTIKIWGTLEYVGNKERIEIWHGCPFMHFSIAGGDERDFGRVLGGGQADVLASSIMEKGRVYHFDYQKSGGWSANDPDAEYWKNFFNEKDLLLPVGEYTVSLGGVFSLSDRVLGSESGLKAELKIKIS